MRFENISNGTEARFSIFFIDGLFRRDLSPRLMLLFCFPLVRSRMLKACVAVVVVEFCEAETVDVPAVATFCETEIIGVPVTFCEFEAARLSLPRGST